MSSGAYVKALLDADLADGAKTVVEIEGRPVLVCKSAGKLYAVSNICSHAEEALDCGRMRGGWIACPVHGARFDLATGAAMNPPATKPIATYPVRIEGDWIEVAV